MLLSERLTRGKAAGKTPFYRTALPFAKGSLLDIAGRSASRVWLSWFERHP
jgi:hypothetical protein